MLLSGPSLPILMVGFVEESSLYLAAALGIQVSALLAGVGLRFVGTGLQLARRWFWVVALLACTSVCVLGLLGMPNPQDLPARIQERAGEVSLVRAFAISYFVLNGLVSLLLLLPSIRRSVWRNPQQVSAVSQTSAV